MVSYADFMTLIFALFVVLYSFAMAKQSEAQAMAQGLAQSFSQLGMAASTAQGILSMPGELTEQMAAASQEAAQEQSGSSAPVQGMSIMDFGSQGAGKSGSEDAARDKDISTAELQQGQMTEPQSGSTQVTVTERNTNGQSESGGSTPGGDSEALAEGGRHPTDAQDDGEGIFGHPFAAIRQSLNDAFGQSAVNDQMVIEEDKRWITINLSSGLLFAQGSSSILSGARPVIREIAEVLSAINNYVRIRGYTDNTFRANGIYKDNWELSAARATSVLNELAIGGVDPSRMAIEGYGQYAPFYSNTTGAGRAQNRRVVIAISRFAVTSKDLPIVQGNDEKLMATPGSQIGNTRIDVQRNANGGVVLQFE